MLRKKILQKAAPKPIAEEGPIKKFIMLRHYNHVKDKVTLRPLGIKLVVDYFKDKHHTNIKLPQNKRNQYCDWKDFLEDGEAIKSIISNQENGVNKGEEYRVAILIGADDVHCSIIIYLNDGKDEAFLIADSLGGCQDKALALQKLTGIDVYRISNARQYDSFSCFTDALVFGRDCTGKDNNGQYFFLDLLKALKDRSFDEETKENEIKNPHCRITLLPDYLLKTIQQDLFLKEHKESTNDKIYKDKNLLEFLSFYAINDGSKTIPGYLFKKGLKLAEIIEIQFYINQLQEKLGSSFDSQQKKLFIKNAKQILRTPIEDAEDLYEAAEKRSDKLHEFVTNLFLCSKATTETKTIELVESDGPKIQGVVKNKN